MEQPKQYTPEEIAQLEKSRTISDADLLNRWETKYSINDKGEKVNLIVNKDTQYALNVDEKIEKREEELITILEKLGIPRSEFFSETNAISVRVKFRGVDARKLLEGKEFNSKADTAEMVLKVYYVCPSDEYEKGWIKFHTPKKHFIPSPKGTWIGDINDGTVPVSFQDIVSIEKVD